MRFDVSIGLQLNKTAAEPRLKIKRVEVFADQIVCEVLIYIMCRVTEYTPNLPVEIEFVIWWIRQQIREKKKKLIMFCRSVLFHSRYSNLSKQN